MESEIENKGFHQEVIPYKSTKNEFSEHGTDVGSALLVILILAWAIYVFLKKKNFGTWFIEKNKKQLVILERTRITSRSSILLIQYKNRSFLISQSGGDHLALIAEVDNTDQQ